MPQRGRQTAAIMSVRRDCHDLPQSCAGHRAHVDTVERRYDAGGPHLVAGGCRTESGSCNPGVSPVSQARRHLRTGRADSSVSGRSRLRRRSRRPSRQRRIDGLAVRRVRQAGTRRWRGGDRLAGSSALVQWLGRDDGNFLGRVQWTSNCGAPSPGTQSNRHHLFDRRSVRRRRALHGRHVSYQGRT